MAPEIKRIDESKIETLLRLPPIDSTPHGYNIFNIKAAIKQISKDLKIQFKDIESEVKNITKEEICYFPVRHHSIASSYALLRLLSQFQPEIIFLEAPADRESFIQFITDAETHLPIAMVDHFKDDKNLLGLNGILTPDKDIAAKYMAWYPFLEYSPEYIAMLYSVYKKIPIIFIDAPYMNTVEIKTNTLRNLQLGKPNIKSKVKPSSHKPDLKKIEEQELFKQSNFFKKFCEFYSVKDLDDAWDLLFEIGVQFRSWEEYREIMLLYCLSVRETIPKNGSDLDITEFREKYMAAMIKKHLNDKNIKEKEALVVTGGLHSSVLYRTKAIDLNQVKKFQSVTELIPFSFKRLSSLSGYGAGNRAPEFYQKIWDKLILSNEENNQYFTEVVLQYCIDIINNSRFEGDLFSSADSIAAFQSAQMLASLRFRPEPNVTDLFDALVLCCVKGDPEKENIAFKNRIIKTCIGFHLGRLPSSYQQLGLIQDFKQRLAQFEIELIDDPQEFKLDLQKAEDQSLSILFWQIHSLDTGVLQLTEGVGKNIMNVDIYHEFWKLVWNPELNVKLGEKSNLGSTVEEAALTVLKDELMKNRKNSEFCAKSLIQCIRMDLIKQFSDIKSVLDQALTDDRNFFQLTGAFKLLLLIRKILEIQKKGLVPIINQLIKKNFLSICSQIPNVANPPDDRKDQLAKDLKSIVNATITEYKLKLNRTVFEGALNSAYLYSNDGRVSGCLLGARYMIDQIDVQTIKMEIIAMTKNVLEIQLKIGQFIRGLIEMCQAKIIFEREFFKIVISVVENIDWDLFMTVLPGLKSAFSQLSARDFDEILEKIAKYYGLKESEIGTLVEPTEDIKSIVTIWDAKVYEIISKWFNVVENVKKKGK
ncbi:MAG: hypothetical protein GF364_07685 [Candidatus Lokiarchaeota archaeon]|nr:hypothetical protein [Candidatus Lokiarchaeota archaeon]